MKRSEPWASTLALQLCLFVFKEPIGGFEGSS